MLFIDLLCGDARRIQWLTTRLRRLVKTIKNTQPLRYMKYPEAFTRSNPLDNDSNSDVHHKPRKYGRHGHRGEINRDALDDASEGGGGNQQRIKIEGQQRGGF